jgi:hypothetical protein
MQTIPKLEFRLIAAFTIETFCITYGLKAPTLIPFFSILYFLAGLIIALLLLEFPESNGLKQQNPKLVSHPLIYKLVFVLAFGVFVFYLSKYWFDSVPVDIEHADMLPIIKVMDQRFINGHWKQVYDIIPEIWKGSQPIYLPATWLPFSVPVFFNMDMRWVTALCVTFVFSVSYFMLRDNKDQFISFLVLIIAAILFWWLITENETHGFVSVSEEGLTGAYFVLLVLGLLSENIFITGIAISLCMLSRYSLIGWIPAFLLYLLVKKKKKEILVLIILGTVFLLGMFIIPFGTEGFIKLIHLPANYLDFARRVWNDSPDVFSGSMGFAKFFGSGRIYVLHYLLITLTFLVPVVFVVYCLIRQKFRQVSNIPLASLKFGLVFFYCLIDVPYLYLFYTSSFVSLIAVSFFVSRNFPKPEPVNK